MKRFIFLSFILTITLCEISEGSAGYRSTQFLKDHCNSSSYWAYRTFNDIWDDTVARMPNTFKLSPGEYFKVMVEGQSSRLPSTVLGFLLITCIFTFISLILLIPFFCIFFKCQFFNSLPRLSFYFGVIATAITAMTIAGTVICLVYLAFYKRGILDATCAAAENIRTAIEGDSINSFMPSNYMPIGKMTQLAGQVQDSWTSLLGSIQSISQADAKTILNKFDTISKTGASTINILKSASVINMSLDVIQFERPQHFLTMPTEIGKFYGMSLLPSILVAQRMVPIINLAQKSLNFEIMNLNSNNIQTLQGLVGNNLEGVLLQFENYAVDYSWKKSADAIFWVVLVFQVLLCLFTLSAFVFYVLLVCFRKHEWEKVFRSLLLGAFVTQVIVLGFSIWLLITTARLQTICQGLSDYISGSQQEVIDSFELGSQIPSDMTLLRGCISKDPPALVKMKNMNFVNFTSFTDLASDALIQYESSAQTDGGLKDFTAVMITNTKIRNFEVSLFSAQTEKSTLNTLNDRLSSCTEKVEFQFYTSCQTVECSSILKTENGLNDSNLPRYFDPDSEVRFQQALNSCINLTAGTKALMKKDFKLLALYAKYTEALTFALQSVFGDGVGQDENKIIGDFKNLQNQILDMKNTVEDLKNKVSNYESSVDDFLEKNDCGALRLNLIHTTNALCFDANKGVFVATIVCFIVGLVSLFLNWLLFFGYLFRWRQEISDGIQSILSIEKQNGFRHIHRDVYTDIINSEIVNATQNTSFSDQQFDAFLLNQPSSAEAFSLNFPPYVAPPSPPVYSNIPSTPFNYLQMTSPQLSYQNFSNNLYPQTPQGLICVQNSPHATILNFPDPFKGIITQMVVQTHPYYQIQATKVATYSDARY